MIAAEAFGHLIGRGDAAVLDDVGIFLVYLFLKPLETALAHYELETRHIAVLAVAVLIENAQHSFNAVDDTVGGKEFVDQPGFDGQRTEATGDHDAEPALAIAHDGFGAHVMDSGDGAIGIGAAVEADFELARHGVREALAQEGVSNLAGIRAHIENFVAGEAGVRAGRDVADGVEAGFAAGHAHVLQHVHGVGKAGERHEVELHVLARGEVATGAGAEIGDVGKAVHLGSSERAAGNFGAHHLDACLPLAVAAEAKPVAAEIVFRNVAGEELVGLGAELFDFRADCVIVPGLEVEGGGFSGE